MRRPIGVTILAALSFVAGLSNLWRVGVYMGWFEFDFLGNKGVQLQDANWAAAIWALLIAAIWFWVAVNFWNMRAAAWQFGTFISLFTLIWGFFALLFGSTLQYETLPMLLALVDLRLPHVAGRPGGIRAVRDVAPDTRAASRDRAAAGRQRISRPGRTPGHGTAAGRLAPDERPARGRASRARRQVRSKNGLDRNATAPSPFRFSELPHDRCTIGTAAVRG